ncbi:MAG: Rieske 2Fe-2S domain-containing protein [Actinobacteria bacterium]|nr:Rieske 2Fe-2S domain-containing protein [Actinomycetota bacterium]
MGPRGRHVETGRSHRVPRSHDAGHPEPSHLHLNGGPMNPEVITLPESVRRILDQAQESIPQGLLPISVFNDPDLHKVEMERIFGHNWVFIGHESEIPHRGDYVLRYIGEDAFIFIRDEKGQIRVMWDSCRHRGSQICRAESGNASHFRCPYHGWTYKNTGELVGMPAYKEAYGGWDRSQIRLHEPAQVDSLYGLVFACLDPLTPPLDEFLGGAKWYMDFYHGLGEMEVVGEPHRWSVDANWKLGCENFAGDEHHTLFLHRSMWEVGAIQVPRDRMSDGYHVQIGNGHTIDMGMGPDPDESGIEYMDYPKEITEKFKTGHLSKDQLALARQSVIHVGIVAPNFAQLHLPLTSDAENIPPIPVKTLRVFQPKGPNEMEVWSWCVVWKGVSEEFKELSHRVLMSTFSPSGIFEQDDVVPWLSITKAAGSGFARLKQPLLNYQMGMEGVGVSKPVPDWAGPGTAYSPRFEEGNQRSFWSKWLRDMLVEPSKVSTP